MPDEIDRSYEPPERFAIQQAIGRLDADKQRFDAFMVHIKWIVSAVSSIVLIGVGFVSFLGISNLNDIGQQLAENAKAQVRNEIEGNEQNIASISTLTKELQKAEKQYHTYKEYIDSLDVLRELESVDRQDPYFAFERLERLESEDSTPANRGTALKLLANIIEAGERGIADPNMLFNSSVAAERLNFQLEAVKLAVLAEHWQPSLPHTAVRAQTTEVLGQTFKVEGNKLQPAELLPKEVRKKAWKDLVDMVSQAPRVGGEHIYSRASNVAVRNRAEGYYQELIDTIVESEESSSGNLTSYAYAKLAQMYVWQGSEGWKASYVNATKKALHALSSESPGATWYDQTIDALIAEASRVDAEAEFMELSKASGLGEEFWITRMIKYNLRE